MAGESGGSGAAATCGHPCSAAAGMVVSIILIINDLINKLMQPYSYFHYLLFQLQSEWAQVQVIELRNDGSGFGFGISGSRNSGAVVRNIFPGGAADRVSDKYKYS